MSQEIRASVFEYLRKRVWEEKYFLDRRVRISDETEPVEHQWALDLPAWDSGFSVIINEEAVGYFGGSLVMHKGFAWCAMTPPTDETEYSHPLGWEGDKRSHVPVAVWDEGTGTYTPSGVEPAIGSPYWCRVCRPTIYTDFDPNNETNVATWYDIAGESGPSGAWLVYPAWWDLPAPLNHHTHEKKTVVTIPYTEDISDLKHGQLMRNEADAVYWVDKNAGVIRPCYYDAISGRISQFVEGNNYGLNRLYRNHPDVRKWCEFKRFYDLQPDPKELISGYIGARHEELHSFPSYTVPQPWRYPYHVMNGTPVGAEVWEGYDFDGVGPYEDMKLEGYQSFVEHAMEFRTRYAKVEEDWHPVKNGWMGFEEIPPIANMKDLQWRCNESSFELALKKIGSFDWYLDTQYVQDTNQYKRRPNSLGNSYYRGGTWRRCWRYSHRYPPSSRGVFWPSELGDPPYLDIEWVLDGDEYINADWWTNSSGDETVIATFQAHMQLIEDAVDAAKADPNNVDIWKAFDDRHRAEDRELMHNLMLDMKAVIDLDMYEYIAPIDLFTSYRTKPATSGKSTWNVARDDAPDPWGDPTAGWSVPVGPYNGSEVEVSFYNATSSSYPSAVGYRVETHNYERSHEFGEKRLVVKFSAELTDRERELLDKTSELILYFTVKGNAIYGEAADTATQKYNYGKLVNFENGSQSFNCLLTDPENIILRIGVDQLIDDELVIQFDENTIATNWTKATPPVFGGLSDFFCSFTFTLRSLNLWARINRESIPILEDYIPPLG